MAIFVVEDDAQNGPDHVDCHRTVALVISPWARRGVVDSTPYTQVGMVRTIELILGLPPMTQYDAAATPMFGCFQKQPQVVAYQPQRPKIDLNAVNDLDAFGCECLGQDGFRRLRPGRRGSTQPHLVARGQGAGEALSADCKAGGGWTLGHRRVDTSVFLFEYCNALVIGRLGEFTTP